MKTSLEGQIAIIGLEGLCCRIYWDDARKPVKTIGLGSTVSDLPNINTLPMDKYFNVPVLVDLFRHGLIKYENAVNKALKVPVSQTKYDALVSITYNIGTAGMAGSTFMRLLNGGASDKAVGDAIMRWIVPAILIQRRTKERDLFAKGVYPGDGTCLLFDTDGKGKRKPYKTAKVINIREMLNVAEKEDTTMAKEAPQKAIEEKFIPKYTYDLNHATMDDVVKFLKFTWNVLTEKK